MTLPPLWPHQVAAIDGSRKAFQAGYLRVVLQLPTGAGKTRCASEVTLRAVAKQSRVVMLAHRTELISQAWKTLRKAGVPCAAISAKLPDLADDRQPVQVASIQTLLARKIRPPADLIIPDECHHLGEGAPQFLSLLDAYPTTRVLGLTATPERGDGTGLAPFFQELVQVIGIRELIAAGHLVACEVIRPSRYLKSKGDDGNRLAQDPVDAYFAHTPGQQGFLFGATVAECQDYATRLEARGCVARCVHANTPADERQAVLDGFLAGRVRVLTNCMVFTEGTDLPMATVCILARGCSTQGMLLQMVGRVLRAAPGKTSATLIDLPGVTHVHGMPEDDRLWKLEGKACIRTAQVCRVCSRPLDEYPCPICGATAPEGDAGGASGTQIVDAPLEKFARMIAQGPQQRYETLDRWIRAAIAKGHKPSSVRHKWRAVYKEEVNLAWYEELLTRATLEAKQDKTGLDL